jgi:hypothetical protein
LYVIPIEYVVPMKLVTLIKMCLNEIYSSRVRLGKHLSDMFRIRNGLKHEEVFCHCFSTLLLEYAIRRVRVNQMA